MAFLAFKDNYWAQVLFSNIYFENSLAIKTSGWFVFRHAGLDPASRNFGTQERTWIPAFVGMTT